LLPVQKPGINDYHPVQDLQAVNQAAVTLQPMVPNLYTLLALIPAEAICFSCLDKRYIFLCPVGTCEPTYLFFPMREPAVRGATTVNLDPSPIGFQELPNHLWNCAGIRFASIPSRGSWLHTLTIYG
jgi:hypothetical protein